MLQIDHSVSEDLIPKQFAFDRRIVPLSVDRGVLTVAMANPNDLQLINAIESLTGLYVEAIEASVDEILVTLGEHADREEEEQPAESVVIDSVVVSSSVIETVDNIIIKAINNDATDIHIEGEKDHIRTRYRIDGILRVGELLPKEMHSGIITRIKIMANINISETRIPQDGGFSFTHPHNGKTVDIRVSTFPTVYDEKVAMRVLDKERLGAGLESLGFSPHDLSTFRELIKRPNGIILATGPTGSGKTTTLRYALLELNSIEKNIITLEDPVEYELLSINQTQVNPKAGLTFANGLRSILRQDPDILMVGEIRDMETLDVAIRAALTGHLVFSTLHTNSAAGTIPRLLNMEVEPYLIASSLTAVISQRLVRVICMNCKEPVKPKPEILYLLGVDPGDDTFYQGRGCERCNKTGFKGRIGIFEVLVNTKEIADFIMKMADSEMVEAEARRLGMKTMVQDGIEKAKAGITTLEEIIRAVNV